MNSHDKFKLHNGDGVIKRFLNTNIHWLVFLSMECLPKMLHICSKVI